MTTQYTFNLSTYFNSHIFLAINFILICISYYSENKRCNKVVLQITNNYGLSIQTIGRAELLCEQNLF